MPYFLIVAEILAGLLILASLLPFVRSDHWTFRIFEFPRIQKLILTVIFLILLLAFPHSGVFQKILILLLVLNFIYLVYLIFPYTRLAPKQVEDAKGADADNCLSILVANVFQDNKEVKKCLATIRKADADIVLMLETNSFWDKSTQELKKAYPYQVLVPLENTYGMLLYSKLVLTNEKVKYLVENDIPSIECKVTLPSGQKVQLYCVHPTPPVPGENPRSTERDKELLLVAEKAKVSKLPVLVFGDLNDVAWSYTTELFLKMSGLLDPRRGRGLFNSFHAKNLFIRFPLDHIFPSPDFRLIFMKRLPAMGSDHFPIFTKFQYDPEARLEQESLEADAADIETAQEKKDA